MKKVIALALAIAAFSAVSAQQQQAKSAMEIRRYWFVLLKAGPNRGQDSATAAKLQQAHIANIERLYNEGKIKVAGPFGEPGEWRGIFIFDAESKEEVEKLLQTDEMIAVGRLTYEIKAWYTAPVGSFVPGKPKGKENQASGGGQSQ